MTLTMHGYTCGLCSWGRALGFTSSFEAYQAHMAAEHPAVGGLMTDPRIDIVDDDDEIVAPDNDPVPEEGAPA